MSHVQDFQSFLNEARVVVKRKYTETHPEKAVSDYAPVREKILSYVKEKGEVSKAELLEFISSMNEETGGATSQKWLTKNKDYFSVKEKNGEKHYTLSAMGSRVQEAIVKQK